MKRDLVRDIVKKTPIKEAGLRVTLARIKKRLNLKSTEQAACYYIRKNGININVSSVIDDRTMNALERESAVRRTYQPTGIAKESKKRVAQFPKIKWLGTPYYSLASNLTAFYGYLFVFENALRLKIDSVMSKNHTDWWNAKIQHELYDVYKYSEDEKIRQAKLPMMGQGQALSSLDYLTVGHLEQIIVKYQSLFVPNIFPTLHFFTGHMVIVKRVRNALAHMSPSTTVTDIRNAKNEIDILLQHLSTL